MDNLFREVALEGEIAGRSCLEILANFIKPIESPDIFHQNSHYKASENEVHWDLGRIFKAFDNLRRFLT